MLQELQEVMEGTLAMTEVMERRMEALQRAQVPLVMNVSLYLDSMPVRCLLNGSPSTPLLRCRLEVGSLTCVSESHSSIAGGTGASLRAFGSQDYSTHALLSLL